MNQEEINEIQEKIDKLQEEKDGIENNEREYEEQYRDMLDETKEYWIKNYYGGTVLKEIDEIAYNYGYSDYFDERLSEIEDEIDNLKEELEEAKKNDI